MYPSSTARFDSSAEGRLRQAWEQFWRAAGWRTRVLGLAEVEKSPFYARVEAVRGGAGGMAGRGSPRGWWEVVCQKSRLACFFPGGGLGKIALLKWAIDEKGTSGKWLVSLVSLPVGFIQVPCSF